jgi:mono/diheme cytochrome c family protein
LKKLLKVGGGVVVVVVVLAGLAAGYLQATGMPSYDRPRVELTVKVTPERVARGRREVTMLCAACHLDPTTGVLSGRPMADVPPEFGKAYAKNITAHPTKGIGAWTDGDLAYLLRTGVRKDGRYTPPWMVKLPHLSDDDLADLIAFLRSDDPMVRSADVDDRESEPSLLANVLARVAFKPFPYPTAPITAPDPGDKVAFGRYLVQGRLACYPCHSADFKTVDEYTPEKSGGYLGGGNTLYAATGPLRSPNITPDPATGIGKWSEEEFRRALKTGIRPDNTALRNPMLPYPELSDDEVAAIYAYLRTVPPIVNAVTRSPGPAIPKDAAPGKQVYYKYGCNLCHGDTGIGVYDLRKGPQKYPTDAQLVAYIRHPETFVPGVKMPTWDGVIREDELAPLAAYVRTLPN